MFDNFTTVHKISYHRLILCYELSIWTFYDCILQCKIFQNWTLQFDIVGPTSEDCSCWCCDDLPNVNQHNGKHNGAATLSMTKFSLTTLSITTLSIMTLNTLCWMSFINWVSQISPLRWMSLCWVSLCCRGTKISKQSKDRYSGVGLRCGGSIGQS